MQQAMLRDTSAQTHIASGHCGKDFVVFITGNPGIPSFYEGFVKALKSRLPSEVAVSVLGHAGHDQPPDKLYFLLDDRTEETKYNLDGQLKHKIAFMRDCVPKDARVHLIGHSIGSWFVLKLLDDPNYSSMIHKGYLLFPTIERMAESPSGKNFSGKVLPIAPLLVFFAWLFSFLPYFVKSLLIRIVGGFFAGVQDKSVKSVIQFLQPTVLRRVLRLAKNELDTVKELDDDAIARHAKKLFLYYGARDGWTPVRYYEELKAKHPSVEAELCTRGFRHAFCLKNDEELGHIIGDMINSTIPKLT